LLSTGVVYIVIVDIVPH
jgi:hypothetical protein